MIYLVTLPSLDVSLHERVEYIEAEYVDETPGGVLKFFTADRELIQAFSPGYWRRYRPMPDGPHP